MGVTVAALQMTSGTDTAANVDAALALIERAAESGATYMQLPEYFNYLGPAAGFAAVAESIPGPTTDRLAALALARGVTIHIGSLLERSSDTSKCFNTGVVLAPSGEVVARYRKAHLFDIDVPGEVVQRESDAIAAGERLVVCDVGEMRLGLSICFDLRFAELYRRLALAGATVIAIPAAFNALTGRAHWEVLVRARAIENHAFVIAAAQAGTTAEGIATYGHALIVGPWGEVLAESSGEGEDVLVAEIDPREVARRRGQIAVLTLRRPDLYEESVDVRDATALFEP
ncbi:MAG: carbon-nitrogen hydrolase family protein [Acidimicrobiales bacterium]|jgi:predicted amidohydrolase